MPNGYCLAAIGDGEEDLTLWKVAVELDKVYCGKLTRLTYSRCRCVQDMKWRNRDVFDISALQGFAKRGRVGTH